MELSIWNWSNGSVKTITHIKNLKDLFSDIDVDIL